MSSASVRLSLDRERKKQIRDKKKFISKAVKAVKSPKICNRNVKIGNKMMIFIA